MRESRTPRGNFAYKKRLIIVFSKISRAICNCEGGGFPQEKHGLSSPAPTKHTSTTLDCKVYGSVFCFLSPFSHVLLAVARNTIWFLIVFRVTTTTLGENGDKKQNTLPYTLQVKVVEVCLVGAGDESRAFGGAPRQTIINRLVCRLIILYP